QEREHREGEGTPEDDCRGDPGHIRRLLFRASDGVLRRCAKKSRGQERQIIAWWPEIRPAVQQCERRAAITNEAQPVRGQKKCRVAEGERRVVPLVDDERELPHVERGQLDRERRRRELWIGMTPFGR